MSTDQPNTAGIAPDGAYAFDPIPGKLVGDYVRGGFSLAVILLVLSVLTPLTIAWAVMSALAALVILYLGNAIYRHGLRVEMDAEGIAAGWRNPLVKDSSIALQRRGFPWDGLKTIRVRYFSRRKLDQNGWTMVKLEGFDEEGDAITITLDGDHEGFKPVLHRAWEETRKRNLMLDEHTLANLEALGIATGGPAPWTS